MELYARWGDEWHYANEFIRPFDGMVMDYFSNITRGIGSPDEQALACWDFVVTEVDYPLTLAGESTDYHLLKAYPLSEGLLGTRFRINLVAEEFFDFPTEILGQRQSNGRMVADCDGTSILLASLLRNALPADRAKAIIGNLGGNEHEANHAWVMANIYGEWIIMETTLSSLPADIIPRAVGVAGIAAGGDNYVNFMEFNDLGFTQHRDFVMNKADEVGKLRGIARIWDWPTKLL